MRPTDPSRILQFKSSTNPGSGKAAEFPTEAVSKDRSLSEVWLELVGNCIRATASNPDCTTNNRTDFLTDESALMADRLLAHYVQRFVETPDEKEPSSPTYDSYNPRGASGIRRPHNSRG